MHPTLSFHDLAFIGRVGGSRIKDLFDENTPATDVPSSIFTFGSGWATNGLLPTPYLAIQAREYFDAYADTSIVSGSALNTGTGWATDTLLPTPNVGIVAIENFDTYTADTQIASSVISGGTGWATDGAPITVVPTPTFSINDGTLPQNVTLSCSLSGTSIYYTTNGTTPTTGSTLYSGAFSVSATTVVKAIAVKTGYINSAVGTNYYYEYATVAAISGCKVWLRADSITGIADAGTIAQWNDSSGQGNHATQSTDANKPTFRLAVLNGLPTVRFDATNDGMTVPYTTTLPNTIFMVMNCASTANTARRAMQGSTNNWILGPYQTKWQFYNGAFIAGPNIVANTFVLAASKQVTGTATFYVAHTSQGTNANNTVTGAVRLGATGAFAEPMNGDIAEILIFDSALSDANRGIVETYVTNKYGV